MLKIPCKGILKLYFSGKIADSMFDLKVILKMFTYIC